MTYFGNYKYNIVYIDRRSFPVELPEIRAILTFANKSAANFPSPCPPLLNPAKLNSLNGAD
jgi:hypothetical protein